MTEAQLRKVMREVVEQNNAVLFGRLTKYLDEKLKAELEPVKSDVHQVLVALDGLAERIETDEHERAAIGCEQERHRAWIAQLAKSAGN